MSSKKTKKNSACFIDLFSGCGGLSLGLIQSGWKGLFAVEKDPMAFSTLKANLLDGHAGGFDWPEWLEKEAMPTSRLLNKHKEKIASLDGKVDLIAGGPPCQGFSLAGRRNSQDPRNRLTEEYINIVKTINPRFLLLENVRGFDVPFNGLKRKKESYAKYVIRRLEKAGYKMYSELVNCRNFGVPQDRTRFIMFGIKDGDPAHSLLGDSNPFELLDKQRAEFLTHKKLPVNKPVTVLEAIKDLEVNHNKLVPSLDAVGLGHLEIKYKLPKKKSSYLELMRQGVVNGSSPTDIRLPKHRETTIKQFEEILSGCKKGRTLSDHDRKRLGIKKQALTPLHPNRPAATITTLPDDILHYSEPRILTVRENARIQSFPDWFSFKGNYTTGGTSRKKECPRYTQVGNAVPPLLSEAIGVFLRSLT